MYQLIYVSSARELFSKEELLSILKKSRENNTRVGVTGLLLYKEGNIMQLLEGEKTVVDRIFNRVSEDDRHFNVITLFRGEVPEREFPDWSMGFHDLMSDHVRQTPGFNEFLNTPLKPEEFSNPSRTTRLLRMFKR
jgi:Sensors of blue-light using FAD